MGYSIQVIPEKSNVLLSRDVYDYMLMQVPQGRLTRWEDIEQYLADRFGVHHVRFDLSTTRFLRYGAALPDVIYAMLDQVPKHREVTARGRIVYAPQQERLLEEEGFVLLKSTSNGHSPRVKDYQKFLFDFEKETDIPIQTLRDVDQKGLGTFLNKTRGLL